MGKKNKIRDLSGDEPITDQYFDTCASLKPGWASKEIFNYLKDNVSIELKVTQECSWRSSYLRVAINLTDPQTGNSEEITSAGVWLDER